MQTNKSARKWNPFRLRLFGLASCLLASSFIFSGCTSVSLSDQVRLSRPGMEFSDSPVMANRASVLSTIEPGTDDRGGAAAAGCTACR